MRQGFAGEDPYWFVLHRRGVRRPQVGQDPLEARAVSERAVRGYLHERICYKWLTAAGFRPGVDFDFQSSQQGGRLELGGMVVDFLFPYMKIAFSVEGPGHEEITRMRKDEEQRSLLAEMGFTPIAIETKVVADQFMFENFMRAVFVDRSVVEYETEDGGVPALEPDYEEAFFEVQDGLNSVEEYIADVGSL